MHYFRKVHLLRITGLKVYIECVEWNSEMSDVQLKAVIGEVASGFGYTLKQEQEDSILQFTKGKDVFISLPTGFGKSLCYILLPGVFDIIRGVEKKSMILVISPLIALMEDQVATIHSFGTSAVYVSDVKMTKDKERIREGKFQVILMSPEALFSGTTWKHTYLPISLGKTWLE